MSSRIQATGKRLGTERASRSQFPPSQSTGKTGGHDETATFRRYEKAYKVSSEPQPMTTTVTLDRCLEQVGVITTMTPAKESPDVTETVTSTQILESPEVTETVREAQISESPDVTETERDTQISESLDVTDTVRDTQIFELHEVTDTVKDTQISELQAVTETDRDNQFSESPEVPDPVRDTQISESPGVTDTVKDNQIRESSDVTETVRDTQFSESPDVPDTIRDTQISESLEVTGTVNATNISESPDLTGVDTPADISEPPDETTKGSPVKKSDVQPAVPCVRTCKSNLSGLYAHCVLGSTSAGYGVPVKAVVDTAADLSIINFETYKQFKFPPPELETLDIQSADENLRFPVRKVGPIRINIGKVKLETFLYVGKITDPMIMGLDLLQQLRATIDLKSSTLVLGKQEIPLETHFTPGPAGEYIVRRLSLPFPVTVPPHSEVSLSLPAEGTNAPFYLLEPDPDIPALVPHTVFRGDQSPRVCFLNHSDEAVVVKAKSQIGSLIPLSEEEVDPPPLVVRQSRGGESEDANEKSKLKEQLESLVSAVDDDVDPVMREKLRSLVFEFSEVFASNKFDLGSFSALSHHIDTGDAAPIKLGMRRTPIHFQSEEEEIVKDMLKHGIIEESTSSWAAAPVLVRKKSGELRYCIDFRALNSQTKRDLFPMPLISECLDALEGNMYFSQLDANAAYWQVPLDENSKEKTAFRTRMGLFHFTRLPFGLCNAPSTFSRVMDLVLRGMNWETALAFLDDIVVLGKSAEDHLANLQGVLARLRQYGLKLKPSKCSFFVKEVEFLGRKISPQGVTLTDHSISTIQEWSIPNNKKEVQQFLGLVNFHRAYIKDLADISQPLNSLLTTEEFEWGGLQNSAFVKLKNLLLQPPVLVIPNKEDPFVLATDCSGKALGGELIQIQNGVERTVAYSSFSLNQYERKYCVTRQELLAVVRLTVHFRHYLLGKVFTIRTDHSSLVWLLNFKQPEGQLARWLEILSSYHLTIEHRAGAKHMNADALSRRPNAPPVNSVGLPCGMCKYCLKHQQKDSFQRLDNVSPLSKSPPLPNCRVTQVDRDETGVELGLGGERPMIRVAQTRRGARQEDTPQLPMDMASAQRQDDNLTPIFDYFEKGVLLSESELFSKNKTVKFYYLNKSGFRIRENTLYFDVGTNLLPVVPDSLKGEVLRLCHDLPTSGHQGIDRTLAKSKLNFYWYGQSSEVKEFVKGCTICNQNKKAGKTHVFPRVIHQAGMPMEKIHLDFIGPLTVTPRGNRYILVLSDNFTKWTEAVPMASMEALDTARVAITEFFCRLGFPLALITDQGTNFQSTLFRTMCELVQVHQGRTTPYRPSANGQVERQNATIMAALRSFVNKKQDDWDLWLPLVMCALRSAVNRQTGFSANKLMLGREVMGPERWVFPGLSEEPKSPNEFVNQLVKDLGEAHQLARQSLNAKLLKEKKDYDVKAKRCAFKKGDAVYFLNEGPAPKGKSKKLGPVWSGPGLIVRVITPYLFVIRLSNITEKTMNHNKLKLCHDTNLPGWLVKIQKQLGSGKDILYCLCQSPADTTKNWIQCDHCLEWFHIECVNMSLASFNKMKGRDVQYFCPLCK